VSAAASINSWRKSQQAWTSKEHRRHWGRSEKKKKRKNVANSSVRRST